MGFLLDPIDHLADHDHTAGYNGGCRCDKSCEYQQMGTALVGATDESDDLVSFQRHAPVGAAFLIVIGLGDRQVDAAAQGNRQDEDRNRSVTHTK